MSSGTWTLGTSRFALEFGLDAPGAMLLAAGALLWIFAAIHAIGWAPSRGNTGAFAVAWLMTLTGSIGVFVSADVVGFYFLLAVLSVGASALVLQGAQPASLRAAAVYLGVALLAEAFLLAALVLMAQSPGISGLRIDALAAGIAQHPRADLIVWLLVVGLGMKAGVVPLHFWMPMAYRAAPTPAAAVMSGVVVKASVIAMIRLLPLHSMPSAPAIALVVLGLSGAFFGVAIGLGKRDPALILAYSSVSQLGFIAAMVGMGGAKALVLAAPTAVAFYAMHHLLVKGALFLAVGAAPFARVRLLMWPAGVIALGLGGLPFTGGWLAKYASKDLMGDGFVGVLAVLSSIATTMLMLHFLRHLRVCAGRDGVSDARRAGAGLMVATWLAMALASVLMPWWIYLATDQRGAFSAFAVWSAAWPVAIGVALSTLISRWVRTQHGGDSAQTPAWLTSMERAGQRMSIAGEHVDTWVRRWPVAGLLLLGVCAATYFALRTWH
ncbi:proton-conducting transporter membrane subunit [Lysobacter sp. LF1]|uniref:Proton-conducting transporter membrane subunit n=1 Tax=Lysobacter stagni TaxID=3045172 RepID=A0ABT6XI66_9GAMM|nr:proton-conducting transporter membrane subunit [Lysobacter sp. LF1]MDI9239847.1 proton-conducting transporter membrane subunit [Lysobacter sp. LF1]